MATEQGFVVALVTLMGCACGDAGSGDSGSSRGSAGGTTGGAAAAGAGTGGGGPVSGAAGTSSGGSGGAAGEGSGLGGQPGAGGSTSSSSQLAPRLARYHRSDTDRALRFELDAVAGLEPFPSSLEYLESFVGRSVDKPDGVSFDADEVLDPVGTDHVWTFDELDAFSRSHASADDGGAVSIHVVFVDGEYDSGDAGGTVLGLAWGQRYIALFQDALRAGCSGLTGAFSSDVCELAERSVWGHEIGHVIGLVDNGLIQQSSHRDPDHGRHDASDGCLMYWAYEGPAVFDVLLSRLAGGQSGDLDFCENCWADLNAARQ